MNNVEFYNQHRNGVDYYDNDYDGYQDDYDYQDDRPVVDGLFMTMLKDYPKYFVLVAVFMTLSVINQEKNPEFLHTMIGFSMFVFIVTALRAQKLRIKRAQAYYGGF